MKNQELKRYIDRNMIEKLIKIIEKSSKSERKTFARYMKKLQKNVAYEAISRYTRNDKSIKDTDLWSLTDEYISDYREWSGATYCGVGFIDFTKEGN